MLLAMFPSAFIVNFEQVFDQKKKQMDSNPEPLSS